MNPKSIQRGAGLLFQVHAQHFNCTILLREGSQHVAQYQNQWGEGCVLFQLPGSVLSNIDRGLGPASRWNQGTRRFHFTMFHIEACSRIATSKRALHIETIPE
jgi:hypothetical protein